MANLILPTRRFIIETCLTPAAVMAVLQKEIRPTEYTFFTAPADNGHFHGDVSEADFRISRIPNGQDSFIQIVQGRVDNSDELTRIEIDLSFHPFGKCLFVLWHAGALLGLAYNSFLWVSSGVFNVNVPALFLLLVIVSAFENVKFSLDAGYCEAHLRKLFVANAAVKELPGMATPVR